MKSVEMEEASNKDLVVSSSQTEAMEECRLYLLYNFEKNDATKEKWEISFNYRQEMFRRYADLAQIIESWPIISKPFGTELVIIFLTKYFISKN